MTKRTELTITVFYEVNWAQEASRLPLKTVNNVQKRRRGVYIAVQHGSREACQVPWEAYSTY